MASSNALDITKSSETFSVALPAEKSVPGEGKEENRHTLSAKNSSSSYLYRLSSDIPEIPDIPSPLMRPPTSTQGNVTGVEPGRRICRFLLHYFPKEVALVSRGGSV